MPLYPSCLLSLPHFLLPVSFLCTNYLNFDLLCTFNTFYCHNLLSEKTQFFRILPSNLVLFNYLLDSVVILYISIIYYVL
uniref:Uncharacterized protein n=1 Tax=Schmidtea mediterranea TaxID=79327 RepID=I1ZIM1_SCHMD|nr:hypothetical protein [Schmidtea mediterranea]